ncbi:MAG: hypothetical protein ACP5IT_08535, partial [Thermoproteota archaeon]
MNKRFFYFLFFVTLFVANTLVIGQGEEHVYYGYAPPSTDVGNVREVINNKVFNYSVPPSTGLLDVLGLQDNTYVSLYDLSSGILLNSTTINRLQKVTFFIRYGTYFKLVSSRRVVAMMSGGHSAYDTGTGGGYSTFYPSVDGGFRGKSFIFMPATGTQMDAYYTQLIGHNFNLFALEDTQFKLSDAIGKLSTTESLKQRGTERALLQARVLTGSVTAGAGYDERFILNSTNDVIVASTAIDQVLYVPAITGGYVGKLFYAPDKVQ